MELADNYYNQGKFDEMIIIVDEYLKNFDSDKKIIHLFVINLKYFYK